MLHQDGAGGGAIGGVLGELREFQLGDGGLPFADGLAQGGAEGGGVELLDDFGTSGEGQGVAAGAPHQNDFRADLEQFGRRRGGVRGERHQHEIEFGRRAKHQVVHSDRAAM